MSLRPKQDWNGATVTSYYVFIKVSPRANPDSTKERTAQGYDHGEVWFIGESFLETSHPSRCLIILFSRIGARGRNEYKSVNMEREA